MDCQTAGTDNTFRGGFVITVAQGICVQATWLLGRTDIWEFGPDQTFQYEFGLFRISY
jgi:hypothetical protein